MTKVCKSSRFLLMENILINMEFRFFIRRYMWWLSSLSNIYALPSKIRPEWTNKPSAPVNVKVCTGRTWPHLMKWVTNDTHFAIILAKNRVCDVGLSFISLVFTMLTVLVLQETFNLGTATRYLVVSLELQNSVTLEYQILFLINCVDFWSFLFEFLFGVYLRQYNK